MDIKKSDRTSLKSYFVKNAVPTASNFADLIDGVINQKEDGIAKLAGEPLSLQADGNDTSQKKVMNFYKNFADPKPAWSLCLNPRVDPNNPGTAKPGWSVGDADGNSKLFIDQTSGNVGIGTVDPGGYKLNVQGPALFTGNYLQVNSENAGRLRVGAAWGMPGIYSSDDGAKPLTLGVAPGQKVYLGVNQGDAFVEGGTGNAYFKGNVGIGVAGPRNKLELGGNMHMFGHSIFLRGENTGDQQDVIRWNQADDRVHIGGWNGVVIGHTLNTPNVVNPVMTVGRDTVTVTTLIVGNKFRFNGGKDFWADDEWLRMSNPQNTAYGGGIAAAKFWTNQGQYQQSDLRLKTEVTALREAPQAVLKLRGVRFKWRDAERADERAIGLIAQEVEEVFPEAVVTGPDGMKGINYAALVAPLIEAVKRQQEEIGELRAEIQALKTN